MPRAKARKGSARRTRKVAVTTDMIVKAIQGLGSRAGSNYKEILKFLQNNYNIRASSGLAVKVAISRGVKTGALVKSGTLFKVPIAAAKRPAKRRRSAKRKGRKSSAKKGRGRRARKASVKKVTKKSKPKSRRRKGRKARKSRAGAKLKKSKAFTKRSRARRATPTKKRASRRRAKSRAKSGRRRR